MRTRFLLTLAAVLLAAPGRSEDDPPPRELSGAEAERADTLDKRVRERDGAGDFAAALEASRELLELRSRVQGAGHWRTVDERWRLRSLERVAKLTADEQTRFREGRQALADGQQLRRKGKSAEAAAPLRLAAERYRDALGADHPHALGAAQNAAANTIALGKQAEAEAGLRTCLEGYTRALGANHPDAADCARQLADCLILLGKLSEAEPLLRQSREALRAALGEDEARVLRAGESLGRLLVEKGDLRQGEQLLRQLLPDRRRVSGREHIDTAALVSLLGDVLQRQGRSGEAEPHFREALAAFRAVWGDEHTDTAMGFGNLAACLFQQGKFAEAEALMRQALAIRRKVLGDRHADTAILLNNLAYILNLQGKATEAEPLAREALAVRRAVLGESHPATGQSYDNLARVLQSSTRAAEAEPLFRKALEITRASLGGAHPQVGVRCNNLARCLDEQGRAAEAAALLTEALGIFRKSLGPEHPFTTNCLQNLAVNEHNQGRYTEAEARFRELLPLRERQYGPEHPEASLTVASLAGCATHLGRHAEAEALLRRAVASGRKTLGDEHLSVADDLTALAYCIHAQGRYDEAERGYAAAARAAEAARAAVPTTGFGRAGFGARSSPLPGLVSVLARRGAMDDAWRRLEEYFARGLLDELALRQGTPRPPEEERRRRELRTELAAADRDLQAHLARPDALGGGAERLAELVRRRGAAVAELLRADANESRERVWALARVRAELPADAALVAWLDRAAALGEVDPAGDHWACVVRREGAPTWVRLRGTGTGGAWSPEEGRLPGRLRRALSDGPDTDPAATVAALYAARLAPLEPHLAGVRQLVVVPTGIQAGIPIEALTDRWRVSYAPSATVYARLHAARRPSAPGSATLFALGDPAFGSEHPRLAGTRREVEAILPLFGGGESLLGADASGPRLAEMARSGALRRHRFLHLATHARVDPRAALRSSLILAPGRVGSSAVSDRLTVADILDSWDLDADLVVLSACETGLGQTAGGEGLMGFAQALLSRGARSLVVSLWPVDDRATALLMARFYQNLLGKRDGLATSMPRAEALREAKHWLRNLSLKDSDEALSRLPRLERGGERIRKKAGGDDPRPFAHPYYWSAFILIGDPE